MDNDAISCLYFINSYHTISKFKRIFLDFFLGIVMKVKFIKKLNPSLFEICNSYGSKSMQIRLRLKFSINTKLVECLETWKVIVIWR